MSAFLLTRETWLDLCAWLMYGKLPMRVWGDGTPGAYLLDRMKYADADILPVGAVGYHAEAAEEAIILQSQVGRKPRLDAAEATGRAVCRALYTANLRAVCSRYKSQPMDGWADMAVGMNQISAAVAGTWKPHNALGILACWDYQCAEDVPADQCQRHNAIRYGVAAFRLEIAEAIIKGDGPTKGWTHRMG